MKSKIVSGCIALSYVTIAVIAGDGEVVFKTGLFLLLPLACIWSSASMGGYTGVGLGKGITSTTPGRFVAFGGWLLLLLPIIIVMVASFSGNK